MKSVNIIIFFLLILPFNLAIMNKGQQKPFLSGNDNYTTDEHAVNSEKFVQNRLLVHKNILYNLTLVADGHEPKKIYVTPVINQRNDNIAAVNDTLATSIDNLPVLPSNNNGSSNNTLSGYSYDPSTTRLNFVNGKWVIERLTINKTNASLASTNGKLNNTEPLTSLNVTKLQTMNSGSLSNLNQENVNNLKLNNSISNLTQNNENHENTSVVEMENEKEDQQQQENELIVKTNYNEFNKENKADDNDTQENQQFVKGDVYEPVDEAEFLNDNLNSLSSPMIQIQRRILTITGVGLNKDKTKSTASVSDITRENNYNSIREKLNAFSKRHDLVASGSIWERHLPPNPIVQLFLSHYGRHLAGPPFWGPVGWYGIYSYGAGNDLHNNQPLGAYKIVADF